MEVDFETFKTLRNPLLIDVRDVDHGVTEHIRGSICVPFARLELQDARDYFELADSLVCYGDGDEERCARKLQEMYPAKVVRSLGNFEKFFVIHPEKCADQGRYEQNFAHIEKQ